MRLVRIIGLRSTFAALGMWPITPRDRHVGRNEALATGSMERSPIGPDSHLLHRAGHSFETADSAREACGVVGVYHPGEDVARIAFFGIYALQHRGQESSGIAASDGSTLRNRTGMGLINRAFEEDDLVDLPGHLAIAHTRYSTTGSSRIVNAQPIVAKGPDVELALAHNGNVINAVSCAGRWRIRGSRSTGPVILKSSPACSPTPPAADWEGRVSYLMRKLKGAYSLTVLTRTQLLGIRDPLGVRPLCIGKLTDGWVMASESCALDHVGAQFVRDVQPGEAVLIGRIRPPHGEGAKRRWPARKLCLRKHLLLTTRQRTRWAPGVQRPHEDGRGARAGTPRRGRYGNRCPGFGDRGGGGIRPGDRHSVWRRTREEPLRWPDVYRAQPAVPGLGVRRKLNPLSEIIRGKRLVVVDDSIVRGTTTPHVVKLLRRGGARGDPSQNYGPSDHIDLPLRGRYGLQE